MSRLKNRNIFIPNGFKFYQPETKWQAPGYASFESIVQSLIAHRKGNKWLIAQHGWSVDEETVREEVDRFNARLCEQMGWTDYIINVSAEVQSPPLMSRPSNLAALRNVAAGADTLVEWIKDGAEAVAPEIAEKRAGVCVACKLNGKGGLSSYFTVPVSEAIRFQLNRRREMQLSTNQDENLGVCEGCLCPLSLKIHMPLERIKAKMPVEVMNELDKGCWILNEGK